MKRESAQWPRCTIYRSFTPNLSPHQLWGPEPGKVFIYELSGLQESMMSWTSGAWPDSKYPCKTEMAKNTRHNRVETRGHGQDRTITGEIWKSCYISSKLWLKKSKDIKRIKYTNDIQEIYETQTFGWFRREAKPQASEVWAVSDVMWIIKSPDSAKDPTRPSRFLRKLLARSVFQDQ